MCDLLWDWSASLQGDGLQKVLSSLCAALELLQDDRFEDEVPIQEIRSKWAVYSTPGSLRETTEAQFMYALGHTLQDDWWEMPWSEAFPPPSPEPIDAVKKNRDVELEQLASRKRAGAKISMWLSQHIAQWRAQQKGDLWPVLQDASSTLRTLSHVSSKEVARLILSVESF